MTELVHALAIKTSTKFITTLPRSNRSSCSAELQCGGYYVSQPGGEIPGGMTDPANPLGKIRNLRPEVRLIVIGISAAGFLEELRAFARARIPAITAKL